MIIPWWIGTSVAALLAVYLNIFYRTIPINLKNIALCFPLMFITNIGFWYGFRQSATFIIVFLLMVAIPTILNVAVGVTYFKETLNVKESIGIFFICVGVYLNSPK